MIVDPKLIAFVGVAALLTVLPGADMALVTKNVLTVGRRTTMSTIAGICAACLLHATASALGISAVLATSATAYNVMKTLGAAYLMWMGVQALRAARHPEREARRTPMRRGDTDHLSAKGSFAALRMTGWRAFRQGFLTDLLNPKVAIFYLTFLPQFISPGDSVLRRSLLLASIHIVMGFAWLSAYSWFVDRLGAVLTRPRVKVWLERVTGSVLVALGARLAWERR